MVMYQKTRKIARICRQRERGRKGGREGERKHTRLARDSRCGEIKGELSEHLRFTPLPAETEKLPDTEHYTLSFLHCSTYTYTYTYIHIHTHPRGRCERSVFTRDWLTYVYVYVCVCVSASLPPPGGPSLKIGPQSKKVKKQLLLSCLPTISVKISTITSRKQSLGRWSLFPGPPWTTIYVFIYTSESHHQTLHTKRPPSPFRPLGHGVDANTKFNTRRTNTGELEKKGKRRREKEKRRKKDTKHCILVLQFQFSWVCFFLYFSFLLLHFFKVFVKKT